MIEAEATLRAGNRDRAYMAYLKGNKANMDKPGVATAALTTFIRKVAYPSREEAENGDNVPLPRPLSEPLFWDK